MIQWRQFGGVGLVCLWLAGCSLLSPSGVSQEIKAPGTQLGKETRLVEEGWEVGQWSPDSSRLVVRKRDPSTVSGNVPLAIVNTQDGLLTQIPHMGVRGSWSPDNTALIIEHIGENQQNELWLYFVQTQKFIRLEGMTGSPLLWRDDMQLVYEAEDGLWSAKLDLGKADTAGSTLAISERTHLLRYGRANGQRWSLPSPHLDSILLYDGTNEQDREWWLVPPNGEPRRMEQRLYSLGTCCAWSEGGRLAFFALERSPGESRADTGPGLYVVDADGKNLKRILGAEDVGAGSFLSMSFSPDGQRIAFEWSKSGEGFPFDNTQIFTVNVDGSGLQNLTPNSAPHHWLRWSPNGRQIAYEGEKGSVWLAQVPTTP